MNAQPEQPATRPLQQYSLAQLDAQLAEAQHHTDAAKEIKEAVAAELQARYSFAVNSRFAALGKDTGTASIDLPDGYELKAEIKKDVKWNSEKLLAIAFTMPWERVRSIFKLTAEVGETIYTGIGAADPALADQLKEARTVTPKPQPFKLVKKEMKP